LSFGQTEKRVCTIGLGGAVVTQSQNGMFVAYNPKTFS